MFPRRAWRRKVWQHNGRLRFLIFQKDPSPQGPFPRGPPPRGPPPRGPSPQGPSPQGPGIHDRNPAAGSPTHAPRASCTPTPGTRDATVWRDELRPSSAAPRAGRRRTCSARSLRSRTRRARTRTCTPRRKQCRRHAIWMASAAARTAKYARRATRARHAACSASAAERRASSAANARRTPRARQRACADGKVRLGSGGN
eukprot:352391-Chlamydomonas_euryale.AAC.2